MAVFFRPSGGFRRGKRRPFWLSKAAGGATNYPVTLSPASFTFTPASLTAVTGRKVTLSNPSFALTVASLSAVTGRKVTLSNPSWSLSVGTLTAVYGRRVTLSPASFTYTPANLSVLTGRKATLSPAAFSWTVASLTATIRQNYSVQLSPVTFTFTPAQLSASVPSTRTEGPADDRPYRRRERQKIWIGPRQLSRRDEEDARKALLLAQEELERARKATVAKRKQAIADTFAALAKAGLAKEAGASREAIEQAQDDLSGKLLQQAIAQELQEIELLISDTLDEIEDLRRKRRNEEEEYLIKMLLTH